MNTSVPRKSTSGEAKLPEEPRSGPLRCGDCHAAVEGSMRPPDPQPGGDNEFYCANCASAVSRTLVCAACGSTICARCGTPVEVADELGIG